ncbi:uncharacterized protein LOC141855136 [Brevipalpus obovatus]|uniref:uncharacterized protein LOC141855136 n=1 Tax=Brevipalpus obovatus TaxID=246614 RepID=UPI003D9F49B1
MSSSSQIPRRKMKQRSKDGHDSSITSPKASYAKVPPFFLNNFLESHVVNNTDAIRFAIGSILLEKFNTRILKIERCDSNLDADKFHQNLNRAKKSDGVYNCEIERDIVGGIERKSVSLIVEFQCSYQ